MVPSAAPLSVLPLRLCLPPSRFALKLTVICSNPYTTPLFASSGQVAQLVERGPEKAGVGGSIPSLATNTFNNLQIAKNIQKSSREQCAYIGLPYGLFLADRFNLSLVYRSTFQYTLANRKQICVWLTLFCRT